MMRRVFRRRYHVRAAAQTVVLLCLVLGGLVMYQVDLDDMQSQRVLKQDCDKDKADPAWRLVFYVIGVVYMFIAIAIACDEFFVPALEEMSSERHLNLSTDVAGATLMAAGGSAPEFFSNFFGTFSDSAIGFGTIVGSAVFNVLFVIAMCALLSKEVLTLTWWPLFRDSSYYAVGLSVLAVFVGGTSKEKIELWEAIVLFVMYIGYIILMYFNSKIYKRLTGKELVYPEEFDNNEQRQEQEEAPAEGGNTVPERGLGPHRLTNISQLSLMSGGSQMSVVSGSSLILDQAADTRRRRRPRTFRAGILKLLRDPNSWVETAGVGIVAKIAGDADYIFRCVDVNNDGIVDREELEQLFEKLQIDLTQQELDDVFAVLDENKDGQISALEFSNWYVRSEERILSRVKHVFDEFDTDQSGTIDRDELKLLLETLEPRVTDEDVDDAIHAMYQSGSHDEITFGEFSDWYRESLVYQRQKEEVEHEMEGVWQNLKPPKEGNCLAWSKYLLVIPLVAVMTVTIPDTQRPGMSKWCYLAFIMSICWIGFFSYLMVSWTETIGHTIGVPSVVMGYTLLAAGTSVPDLLSSVIVARQGFGDMAVSSSIGSNIFDILVGLPLPWIIYMLWPSKPSYIEIGSKNILISVLILLGMLVFVIVTIHCQGWKLTKMLAFLMMLFYIGFLVQAILLELPFDSC